MAKLTRRQAKERLIAEVNKGRTKGNQLSMKHIQRVVFIVRQRKLFGNKRRALLLERAGYNVHD